MHDHERRQFANSQEAGDALAARLQEFAGRPDAIVLGLPRGGVPVAARVAEKIGAPLGIFLVRKLGTPGHPELAMGAIAPGGVRVLNEDVIRWYAVTDEQLDAATAQERETLQRRVDSYLEGREPLRIED